MDPSSAKREINRIERELDAKHLPPGKSPARPGQSGAGGGEGSEKNQSMDAVLIGVVRLLGIGASFAHVESLTRTKKTQLSAGAVSAAAGLAVGFGYGVGRLRP